MDKVLTEVQKKMPVYTMILLNDKGEEVFRDSGNIFAYTIGNIDKDNPGVITSSRGCHGEYTNITRAYLGLGSHIHAQFLEQVPSKK